MIINFEKSRNLEIYQCQNILDLGKNHRSLHQLLSNILCLPQIEENIYEQIIKFYKNLQKIKFEIPLIGKVNNFLI